MILATMILAIIPARVGAKHIPNKNFRPLAGISPCARALGVSLAVADRVVCSTDARVHG